MQTKKEVELLIENTLKVRKATKDIQNGNTANQ